MSEKPGRVRIGREGYGLLLRYALADGKGWALIVVVTLLSSAFGLLGPWPMKLLVDHVLGHEPMHPAVAWGVDGLPGAGTTRSRCRYLG